jgi:uncharacterized protein
MGTTAETRAFVTELFASITGEEGGWRPLLDALADDLEWTVTGSTPISGTYRGKADYVTRCFCRLDERLARWPDATVEEIVVDGDVAVVFFTGTGGLGHNGTDYAMRYCWRMHVAAGRVDHVTGYIDGVVVNQLFS